MTRTYGVVHGLAECCDCEWTTQSYKNAQALAAKHARKYGHRVNGELGIAFSYTGGPEPEAPR
jgi:hypothetical protein